MTSKTAAANVRADPHFCTECGSPCAGDRSWTQREVAAFLRMSVSWVNKAARRGKLPSFKIGWRRFFVPAKVRAYRDRLAEEQEGLAA